MRVSSERSTITKLNSQADAQTVTWLSFMGLSDNNTSNEDKINQEG